MPIFAPHAAVTHGEYRRRPRPSSSKPVLIDEDEHEDDKSLIKSISMAPTGHITLD
jgi:hypothetical protein